MKIFIDLIKILRASQAINTFLQKDYTAALIALKTLHAEVANLEFRSGRKILVEPFLKILQLAVDKILHKENKSVTKDLLKEHFLEFKKKSPDLIQTQKDKYDALVEQGKKKEFEDQVIFFMYEAGVDLGKFGIL